VFLTLLFGTSRSITVNISSQDPSIPMSRVGNTYHAYRECLINGRCNEQASRNASRVSHMTHDRKKSGRSAAILPQISTLNPANAPLDVRNNDIACLILWTKKDLVSHPYRFPSLFGSQVLNMREAQKQNIGVRTQSSVLIQAPKRQYSSPTIQQRRSKIAHSCLKMP
jgi:hypothetical protein